MPGRVAEVVAVAALATIVTVAIAAPVLRAPSERVFGMAIVGRHHDPFTVMEQLGRPIRIGVYSQPVTDIAGALLARVSGVVAAYNWLVLLSFPLSAAAAYLLARQLTLSPAGATLAALAYAFSPFHLAHAAYHPHIAQTQWMPLYLLALWRCLDEAAPLAAAVGLLGVAAVGVTLSNFYGGLSAAVITPVAVAACWLLPAAPGVPPSLSRRRLGITVAGLVLIAVCGVVYLSHAAGAVMANRAAFAFPRTALFAFGATWWSYLVPPVAHPLAGAAARRFWTAGNVGAGMLEQQVSLGWGLVALALIAVVQWCRDRRSPAPALAPVPLLAIVGATALVCSLAPPETSGAFTLVWPSALLYDVVPMFRAYARFGVVVQLMTALLAGIGVDALRRAGSLRAQIVCLALVAFAAGEYAVSPSTLWRDVLPTRAHRWVVQQPEGVRVLDCAPLNQESASVLWLTRDRVQLRSPAIDCTEPHLSQKLAAAGYTHLLVRRESAEGHWFDGQPALDGLRAAARFDDGEVFVVTAATPAIYTAAMTGFFPREHDAESSWRWMGADAAWTIVNTSTRPIVADLGLDISAFHRTRYVELRLDGQIVQTLVVEPSSRIYQIGPLSVPPGDHALGFHPADAPEVARDVIASADSRRLSFALGAWTWTVRSEQP